MALGQSVVKRVQRFAELPAVQRYTYLNAGSNGPLPRRSVAALTQQAKSELKEISDLAHFEVIPLNANGLRQAIVRPAERSVSLWKPPSWSASAPMRRESLVSFP